MTESPGFEVHLELSQPDAIERVTDALKKQGFGVLTRIDIDHAFKEKIGADFRPYTILGACNPQLAHSALTSNPEIGLMLPCNVVVEAAGKGSLVRVTNPRVMLEIGESGADNDLAGVADDAAMKLEQVVKSLAE